MPIWTLAIKDLRLLLRDRRVFIILLAMPVIFILVLGVSLGEGFFSKPDERLRVSVLDLDRGEFDRSAGFPPDTWAQQVRRDLDETAGIRVEMIPSAAEAVRLVRQSERSAVLVFGPDFSKQASHCSFLVDGINPFYRDGVKLTIRDAGSLHPEELTAPVDDPETLNVILIRDPTQRTAASIIEQVGQVSLLRVIMPWMIGRAFEKIGQRDFIEKLSERVEVTLPLIGKRRLSTLLTDAGQKQEVGQGIQRTLQDLFTKYNLKGKTWADMTRSPEGASRSGGAPQPASFGKEDRYQILVPMFTVMFAFFLVLTVGWLFVAERRQGTLKRLRAAPLTRAQILFGKMVPCFLLSLGQGVILLAAGKLAFNMSWGPQPLWLVPVVVTTSLAAMGLSLLVASLARTETQVAIYGTLLVLVLGGVSGCLMPRQLMPELMRQISLITPHAWALEAYNQLLNNPNPELAIVGKACAVLALFGAGFVALAWWFLRLD
jgi:ABC-type Na+ efflux pump permease subunit